MAFKNNNNLVKNLSATGFKYLSLEFSGELLELVKQIGVYLYQFMDSFKKINYLIGVNL